MRTRILTVGLVLTLFCGVELHAGTLTVTNTNDSGANSLRDAIIHASEGDAILFAIPTTDPHYDAATGTYTVTLTSDQISIDKSVTIDSQGQRIAVHQQNLGFCVFRILNGTVNLVGLMIEDGA